MDFADNSFYFCLTFLHSKNRITLWREVAIAARRLVRALPSVESL